MDVVAVTNRRKSGHVGTPQDDWKSDEVGDLQEVGDGGRLVLVLIVGVSDVVHGVCSSLQDLPTQSI